MLDNLKYCENIAKELEAIYNCEVVKEDGEFMTLYEYFDDVLDFEYTCTSSKEFKSVKIWITLGGPNVWIDTSDSYVRLAWGSDREEYPLSYDVSDEINAIFEEYFYC